MSGFQIFGQYVFNIIQHSFFIVWKENEGKSEITIDKKELGDKEADLAQLSTPSPHDAVAVDGENSDQKAPEAEVKLADSDADLPPGGEHQSDVPNPEGIKQLWLSHRIGRVMKQHKISSALHSKSLTSLEFHRTSHVCRLVQAIIILLSMTIDFPCTCIKHVLLQLKRKIRHKQWKKNRAKSLADQRPVIQYFWFWWFYHWVDKLRLGQVLNMSTGLH